MKHYLLFFLLLCFSASAFPQLSGDGYYRLQNRYTERYIRLRDAYGFVDIASTDADMSAVLTRKPYSTSLSDPASILYIKSVPAASGYDLYCQGTSLYSVIGYYVKMKQNGEYYQAYAERSGYTIYLADPDNNGAETATLAKFNLKSGMKTTQRDWLLHPVSSDDDNYLGVAPTVSCAAKYYTSYYTSFPYSFQSDGMKAYYVSKLDSENGIVVYQEVTTDDIPQATPVFLECSSSDVSQNRLDIHSSSAAAPADNLLKGVYFCRVMNKTSNPHNNYVKNDTSTVRVLGVTESGGLGYVKSKDTYLPENSSYLTVPANSPAELKLMTPEEYKKYIEEKSKLYALTYYVDGVYYATDSLHSGDRVVARLAPEKEGYTFSGWSDIPAAMPAYDVTVSGFMVPNVYELTYLLEGEVYKSDSLAYGAEIIPESYPVRQGYSFDGWSNLPDTMPAHDVTVTGSFSTNGYMLTYMLDDEVYKSFSVTYGAVLTPEPAPEKEGYTFSGWEGLPETMPAQEVTVTGWFTINYYKLTYYVDTVLYKCDTLVFGDSIHHEPEPVKQGYVFSGWSEIPETMPAYDVDVVGYFTVGFNSISADVKSIRYFNLIGRELSEPEEGILIVVTTYSDGRSVRERVVYR